MSEKSIGIINQKYEDSKTGKSGVLVGRDEKYKTLIFEADDASTFSVSVSSFRSNWRKCKDENAEESNETVEETTEKTAEQETSNDATPVDNVEPQQEVSFVDAITAFVKTVSKVRNADYTIDDNGEAHIVVDNMPVITILPFHDVFSMAMLPDIFTLSEWKGIVNAGTIEYKLGAKDYLGVTLDTCQNVSITTILNTIEDAVKEINLYGYTIETDNTESEENNNA